MIKLHHVLGQSILVVKLRQPTFGGQYKIMDKLQTYTLELNRKHCLRYGASYEQYVNI